MAADANRRVRRGNAHRRNPRGARPAQPTCPTVSVAPQHFVTVPSPGTLPRGSSKYIGRVGALAVALGVGVLVTTGQGLSIARADTGTDSSSAPSADGSPAAGAGGATGTATAPPADADSLPGPSNAPGSPPDAGANLPTTAGESTAPQMHLESSGGLNTSTNDAGQSTDDDDEIPAASTKPELDAAPAAGTESDAESVGTEGSVAHHNSSAGEPTPIDTASTADPGEPGQESAADLIETAEPHHSADVSLVPLTVLSTANNSATGEDQQTFAAFTRQASTVSEVQTLDPVARGPIRTLGAVIVTGVVNVATTVVNLLLSPFLAANPLGPTPQPLTLGELLGSIVTAIRYRVFNDAPVVGDRDITLVLGPADVSDPIPFNASDGDGDDPEVRGSREPPHRRASARHGDHRSSDRNVHLRPRRGLHRSR